MIEQVITMENLRGPGAGFSFFRTAAGAEIDLVVRRGSEAVGYEFKSAAAVARNDARGLRVGMADGVIDCGYVVYLGERRFPLYDGIDAIGAEELLTEGTLSGSASTQDR